MPALSLDFQRLRRAYAHQGLRPQALVAELYRRIAQRGDDHVWLHLLPLEEALKRAREVEARFDRGESLPLYGLPYGIKDNIDAAGLPTTAGCAAFSYVPPESAAVVQLLDAAGALLLGKHNLDQFATGLVGIRNPAGFCRNSFSDEHIPGGSSSGSAVAVAAGLLSFSIGSDTGGSGRVPAACNNIVGLKPTPGVISTRGFVYGNRSFDVAPVFALTVDDAYDVLQVLAQHDPRDTQSSPEPLLAAPPVRPAAFSFGLPPPSQREFFGDLQAARQFERAVGQLIALGGTASEIDLTPFLEAGSLVFDSALVAERWVSYGAVASRRPEAVDPAVLASLRRALDYTAADAFAAQYRLAELRQLTHDVLRGVDLLLLPTCATLPRWAEVQADPQRLNTRMGRYTYFANPLHLSAISVPAGLRDDGLPFGVSLIGLPRAELRLRALARALHERSAQRLGATPHALRPTAS
ncbi:allophanate hydrolase [Roseateles violae]|uniref:Allophanate hydrolase n=1 Tax=Roseateles violae TaxID=3058042 RepID=A0ABT8DN74_9BURK|nr:allophanate hydrolase [Pelomonas sp. PFR6]MDN3919835.1 allophanate hydrolase [Pelomonas sp. PFR6]